MAEPGKLLDRYDAVQTYVCEWSQFVFPFRASDRIVLLFHDGVILHGSVGRREKIPAHDVPASGIIEALGPEWGMPPALYQRISLNEPTRESLCLLAIFPGPAKPKSMTLPSICMITIMHTAFKLEHIR